jgi:uncharacterized RDD family membrane protein YckC
MQWYYASSGNRLGPIEEAEFRDLVSAGTISANTEVWHEGMPGWQSWATVRDSAGGGAGNDETAVCAVSGKRFPKREMIQYQGKWISAEQKDAFFQRVREGVEQPASYGYGGFWKRFLAKFLDGLILWVCSTGVNLVLAFLFFGQFLFGRDLSRAAMGKLPTFFAYQGTAMLAAIGIGLCYVVFFVRRYDATPGKMALGLKLQRADGSKLSIGRIIGRHFSEWVSGMIFFIGYLMAAFDDQKRALHDRICDTRVVLVR